MNKALLVVYPGGLAGGGTLQQIRASYTDLAALAASLGMRFETAWDPRSNLPAPTFPLVLGSAGYYARHQELKQWAGEVRTRLHEQGVSELTVYGFGYTSFIPYAFEGYDDVRVIWGDCSPPDTDVLGGDLSSRFYGKAYERTRGLCYGWHEGGPLTRRPLMYSYSMTAQPFGKEYVGSLLAQRLTTPEPLGGEGAIRIVLSASDIWSPNAIGVWMTEQQHRDTVLRTALLMDAIRTCAQQLGRKVVLYAHPTLRKVNVPTRSFYPNQSGLEGFAEAGGITLVDTHTSAWTPEQYRALLRSANLVVTRASHSVTSAECAAMGIPQALCPMPSMGYMNEGEFTSDIRDRGLAMVLDPLSRGLWRQIATALTDDNLRRDTTRRACEEFDRINDRQNFFKNLATLIEVSWRNSDDYEVA